MTRRLYTEEEVRKLIDEATGPLLAQIAQLKAEVARLKKDSSTSSKPPSSDIVKPPRKQNNSRRGRRKRKPGGQPGHERYERTPFPPEEVDKIWNYEWSGSAWLEEWEALDEFQTIQQVELLPKLFEVTEHRARLYQHRVTGEIVAATLPDEVVSGGLIGPRMSALIAYQKGACHMSYRVIQTFLSDVVGLEVCSGQLVKIVGKARRSLAWSYQELVTALPLCSMVCGIGQRSAPNGR